MAKVGPIVYTYDNAGRPTGIQYTTAGKARSNRIYAYDSDTKHLGCVARWGQEEGWEYEYSAYHHPAKPGSGEGHIESAVLYQPLGSGDETAGEGITLLGSAIPLCKAGFKGPCASAINCRYGNSDNYVCRNNPKWRRERARSHPSGGPTIKDGVCTVIGAAGGAVGDVPGALIAGGACVTFW